MFRTVVCSKAFTMNYHLNYVCVKRLNSMEQTITIVIRIFISISYVVIWYIAGLSSFTAMYRLVYNVCFLRATYFWSCVTSKLSLVNNNNVWYFDFIFVKTKKKNRFPYCTQRCDTSQFVANIPEYTSILNQYRFNLKI